MLPRRTLSILAVFASILTQQFASAEGPKISEMLHQGELAKANHVLNAYLDSESEDDLARFQLGTVQMLCAIEQLAQDGSRYGTLRQRLPIPIVRVGGFGGPAEEVEPITYQDVRRMIADFQQAVAEAERTLSSIEATDLYWPVDLNEVSLDLNNDGQCTQQERLSTLFTLAMGQRRQVPSGQPISVGFDSADVYWLRGYCHVLMGISDMILAYDHERLFELTAHLIYTDPQTEFALRRKKNQEKPFLPRRESIFGGEILDAIAMIHLCDFELKEPERMHSAREHFLNMVRMSRLNWELLYQETDNRNELVPNPEQESVIPGMVVNNERREAWQRFLNEAEDILNGEKLIPFWRNGFDEGVNLKRFFDEPRDFDLVLWVQGTAALPYLEEGQVTKRELWGEFQRIFRGNFLGFALRVN